MAHGGNSANRPVFLLTDFGTGDVFAGVMKAVILRASPTSPILDLSHGIPAGDVLAAAMHIEDAIPYLPPGSVVCAVVDPGVGSDRRPLAVRAGGLSFVAPDNGILTPAFDADPACRVFTIRSGDHNPLGHSATFHGRDVFAPAAARLACGESIESLGEPTTGPVCLRAPAPRILAGNRLELEILAVDHFGNLTLNLRKQQATGLYPWISSSQAVIEIGSTTICGISRTYSDVPPGAALAYWNSSGRLELGVRDGRAESVLAARRGGRVILSLRAGA
ncbi:SAM-dependent chlorinase/fluorinase [Candidatus Poribacteria bacterium]|nr:SAM-dependent chlorinase/fluorinase [Candidatus Poribacteria bacterium]